MGHPREFTRTLLPERSINFLLTACQSSLNFCQIFVNSLFIVCYLSVFPKKWSANRLLIAKKEVCTEVFRMGRLSLFWYPFGFPQEPPKIYKIHLSKFFLNYYCWIPDSDHREAGTCFKNGSCKRGAFWFDGGCWASTRQSCKGAGPKPSTSKHQCPCPSVPYSGTESAIQSRKSGDSESCDSNRAIPFFGKGMRRSTFQ